MEIIVKNKQTTTKKRNKQNKTKQKKTATAIIYKLKIHFKTRKSFWSTSVKIAVFDITLH